MRILFIGDITGAAGISILRAQLPRILEDYPADVVIANAENAAPNGRGITPKIAEQLYDIGVEILTMGNHTWDQREAYQWLADDMRVVRPANFHVDAPGRGYTFCKVGKSELAIGNLIGRTYMGLYACPFEAADRMLSEVKERTPFCLIDFHAEVTSEKLAMGWYLAGRASVVVSTHTHVQTADERILPGKTAFISDVGMTGPRDGILGVKRDLIIKRFIDQMPVRFELAEGAKQLSAVYVVLADDGRAQSIERILIVSD
ncbi:MAG: TIGR00282 family metallophosphoesterase [Firmicutes bacterium]|nr:TIGR00282 family metallophosphoesterase [Bacillota bacterium]